MDEFQNRTKELFELIEEHFDGTRYRVEDLVDYDFVVKCPDGHSIGVAVHTPSTHSAEWSILIGEIVDGRDPSQWHDLAQFELEDKYGTTLALSHAIASFINSY